MGNNQYPKTIRYPAFINVCADIVGSLRDLTNLEMNESAVRFKRGDRGGEVNRLGMRGELIARFICHKNNYPFQAPPLLSENPVSGADLIYGEYRFDIKTIRSDAPDLLVNQEAHVNPKKDITHYWFFQQQDSDVALYWIYSHEEVSSWSIKNVRYSDAYYLPIGGNHK